MWGENDSRAVERWVIGDCADPNSNSPVAEAEWEAPYSEVKQSAGLIT